MEKRNTLKSKCMVKRVTKQNGIIGRLCDAALILWSLVLFVFACAGGGFQKIAD